MSRIIYAIALMAYFFGLKAQEIKPERQFDFWVGEWDVTDSGQVIATSIEQFLEDSSIIMENYSQKDGYTGKSINFYDRYLKKWRQTWVDRVGNVSEFTGEYRDGAMVFEGESHRANGKKILRKMIFYNLGYDKIRQYSEMSLDNGKTWQIAYDFIYVRKR
ncbi:hypothetical protein HUU42_00620 [bacterium]|nr:hypothetical protein [bacterium]